MVEIGVREGNTSFFLLDELGPRLRLVGVDPYFEDDLASRGLEGLFERTREAYAQYDDDDDDDGEDNSRSSSAGVRPRGARGSIAARAKLIRATSEEAAPRFPDGGLDLVFLDGDHSLEGVRKDLELWAPKLRPGGILAGRDYMAGDGVRPAVHEFMMLRRGHRTRGSLAASGSATQRQGEGPKLHLAPDWMWWYELPKKQLNI